MFYLNNISLHIIVFSRVLMKQNITKDYNQQDTKATFYDLRSADQHNSAVCIPNFRPWKHNLIQYVKNLSSQAKWLWFPPSDYFLFSFLLKQNLASVACVRCAPPCRPQLLLFSDWFNLCRVSTLSSVALNIFCSFQTIFCTRYLNGSLLNWFTYFLQC